jgi:chemotaxis protein CheX
MMGTAPVAHVDEGDMTMIVESIFAELLGLSVQPAALPAEQGPGGGRLVGLVRISGGWHGTVSVSCEREAATRIAAVMLDREPRDAAEVADAMGEVANMAGGNVKALLPGPSLLSLPEVAEEGTPAATAPGDLVSRLAFAIDGSPLVVTVVEQPKRDDTA